MVLPGGGQCRQRAPVKAIVQRDDDGILYALFVGGVFARHLNGTFVCLGTGVGKEHFFHAGFFA
ncbi:hypothetical protein SDC9_201563 [bioreactor metagenome]|uniref:Uncharacterized protein n=1 Tax=bioreactor metagenome TaxID=1076179 RepID=A0A645IRB3_9ZZZZ